MILKERPTKESIKENKPDFWLISNNAWEHPDNKPNGRVLLDWLIWNVDFTIKSRVDYILKNEGFTAALIELVKKLHKLDNTIYLDKNILMIWKK